jgi:seryl-tRNA synthetase
MHDLSFFRANLDSIAQRLATRGYQLDLDQFRALDSERREALTQAEQLKAQVNTKSAEIGKLRQAGQDTTALQQESGAFKDRISALDEKAKAVDESFRDLMAGGQERGRQRGSAALGPASRVRFPV